MCCSVLQCVVVCCSVLQCVAVCCSVLQCVAVCCSVLQCVAVCCSVLQCVAVCCSVLQREQTTFESFACYFNTSPHCKCFIWARGHVLQCIAVCLQCVANSVLQCVCSVVLIVYCSVFAVCCSVLQCVCSVLLMCILGVKCSNVSSRCKCDFSGKLLLQHAAAYCNTLQPFAAVCCSAKLSYAISACGRTKLTLCVAVCCDVLQLETLFTWIIALTVANLTIKKRAGARSWLYAAPSTA